MAHSFKAILSSMPSKVNTGDLVDISRLALRVVTQEPLASHKARVDQSDVKSCQLRGHNVFNLVAHTDRQQEGRVMWFMLAASCYLRVLQVAGYFATKKIKVPAQLNEDEIKVGGMIVELILKLQFNSHSITEATDAREAKSQVLNGEFVNRTGYITVAQDNKFFKK